MEEQPWRTLEEAAEWCGLNQRTVQNLASAGEIPSKHEDGEFYVRVREENKRKRENLASLRLERDSLRVELLALREKCVLFQELCATQKQGLDASVMAAESLRDEKIRLNAQIATLQDKLKERKIERLKERNFLERSAEKLGNLVKGKWA